MTFAISNAQEHVASHPHQQDDGGGAPTEESPPVLTLFFSILAQEMGLSEDQVHESFREALLHNDELLRNWRVLNEMLQVVESFGYETPRASVLYLARSIATIWTASNTTTASAPLRT